MNADKVKELLKNQCNYSVDPSVRTTFCKQMNLHQVQDQTGNVLVTGFPYDTSENEMRMVARILHGVLVDRYVEVLFMINNNTIPRGNKSIGQRCIPGVVKASTIIATYPELIDNYDITHYNTMKQVADLLGGRMENIVHTMWAPND